MRNIIITFLIVTASFSSIYGQDNKFDIGVEGGPSLIYLRGNYIVNNQKFAIGYSYGVIVQYNLSKNISIRSGLSYERKGSMDYNEITDNNGNYLEDAKVQYYYKYINLPILVRATFGQNIKYFINVGPYFGYLTSQYSTIKSNYLNQTGADNSSDFNRLDAGISIGLGAQIPIKEKFALSFEIRNNQGYYNISPKLPVMTSSTNLLLGVIYKL